MLDTCPVFELTKPQVGIHESTKPQVGKLVPLKTICKGLLISIGMHTAMPEMFTFNKSSDKMVRISDYHLMVRIRAVKSPSNKRQINVKFAFSRYD